MTRSDASLKGKIKAMAKKSNLKPQELLQMYLFEHLLMRLEKSDYAETFVLKGGLLISSMTGIAQRTTMDMGATVVGMDMDEGTASAAISSICSVDVGGDMEYSFERLEPIRAAVLEEVRKSSIMQGIWASYVAGSPYAAGLDFEDVVDSALKLARLAELDELG